MSKVVYIGAFLDVEAQWRLLAAFPPRHALVYGDHVTLCFKPTAEELLHYAMVVGEEFDLDIAGEAHDEMGQAVLVHNVTTKNKQAHITISTSPGTKPVYSNKLAEGIFHPTEHLRLRATIDTYPRTQGEHHGR